MKKIAFIFLFFFFIGSTNSCFIYVNSDPLVAKVLKNKNVSEVKIINSKIDFIDDFNDLEIVTKDGNLIVLHNIKHSLKNKGIHISQINNICYQGGEIYELTSSGRISYDPTEIVILEKMIEKQLVCLDDIIDNIDELYDLYKIFFLNSQREFMYKNKFLVKACFESAGTGSSGM